MTASILTFAVLALAVTLTPGADTVLVLRTSLRSGAKLAIITAIGVSCGAIVWGALAGYGVALFLTERPVAYTLVTFLGAAYLISLAVGSYREALRLWRLRDSDASALASEPPPRSSAFLTGLLTNLLNPKIGVFYVAVMPGLFQPSDVTLFLGAGLASIHAALGVTWLAVIALFASKMRRFLARPRSAAVVEAIAGLALLSFGMFILIDTFVRIVS